MLTAKDQGSPNGAGVTWQKGRSRVKGFVSVQGEQSLLFGRIGDTKHAIGDILTAQRTHLESMAGATPGDPKICAFGMRIDDKMLVVGILQRANTTGHHRLA